MTVYLSIVGISAAWFLTLYLVRTYRSNKARKAVETAKRAHDSAWMRGDTRSVHETRERLVQARTRQLKMELGR